MIPSVARFGQVRWLSWLGVLALVLVIWFLGPGLILGGLGLLVSEGARLAVIALLVAGWLTGVGIGHWNRRRKHRRLIASPVTSAGRAEQPLAVLEAEREMAILRRRYEEAVEILKSAQGGDGGERDLLRPLPCYLVLGPRGAGKTALIRHSGLERPALEQFGAAGGKRSGGTENCDWWFTEEAVLLDTAGRYLTQDSNQVVDSAAWLGFLALLQRFHPQRPLNGVILALSIPDLLSSGEEARHQLAGSTRKRINELYQHLGERLPFYVLLTKADLLPGFVEIFEDMEQNRRDASWGITFTLNPEHPAAGLQDFAKEFERLGRAIKQRSLDRLQQAGGGRKSALIYGFPAAVAALGEPLREFLTDVFLPSRFEPEFLLRGVYLVSGTQEGSPLDQLADRLGTDVGLAHQGLSAFSGKAKSYFLTRLFRDVILPEAGLIARGSGQEPRPAGRQLGALVFIGALTSVFVIGLLLSFFQQRQYLAALDGGLHRFERALGEILEVPNPEISALLPVLNAAREVSTRSNHPIEHSAWLPALQLLPSEGLAQRAGGLYPDVLRRVLFPRIVRRLEEQLRVNAEHPELAYEALKLYGMLGGADEWATTGK